MQWAYGPQYCETPLGISAVSFPVEPFNTWSNLAIILIYSFNFDCLAGDFFSLTEAVDFLHRIVFHVLAAWGGRNLTSNNREYCHFKHSAISI